MKKSKSFLLLLLLSVFCLTFSAQYTAPEDFPNPKDHGDGFITDPQDYLPDDIEEQINEACTQMRDSKGFELAVVIVNSIDYMEPLPLAVKLGNYWGVGIDNRGLLMLIAVEDRNMAIATGETSEEYFTDFITKEIQEEEIIPYFKLDDYPEGVLQGVLTIQNIVNGDDIPEYVLEAKKKDTLVYYWEIWIIVATLLALILGYAVSRSAGLLKYSLYAVAIGAGISVIVYFLILNKYLTSSIIIKAAVVLVFIAVLHKTYVTLKENTNEIWPIAVLTTLFISVPAFGLYAYGHYFILLAYFAGAGILFGLFLIFFMVSLFLRDPHKKYHTLQFFKLDAFGYIFPLPMFIVDLTVEALLDKWRNQTRFSKKTGMPMVKLSEVDDDKYLKSGNITEEEIGSVDYDVWITEDGDDILILRYAVWFSGYSKCPSCKFKTWKLEYDRTIRSASYSHSGLGEKKYSCSNCNHSKTSTYTIAKLQRSSSSSSSGGYSSSSSGGSFGGGSFGGGGSSSSW